MQEQFRRKHWWLMPESSLGYRTHVTRGAIHYVDEAGHWTIPADTESVYPQIAIEPRDLPELPHVTRSELARRLFASSQRQKIRVDFWVDGQRMQHLD